jgi:hypothetical protein
MIQMPAPLLVLGDLTRNFGGAVSHHSFVTPVEGYFITTVTCLANLPPLDPAMSCSI